MRTPNRTARAGFSLMELVIAVTIMSVLAAVAVPVAGTVLDQGRRQATMEEMQDLVAAAEAAFVDTLTLPADLEDLAVDPGDDGWTGPYLVGTFDDHVTGLAGYGLDAWSRAYRLDVAGDVWTLTSDGPDGKKATDDDLVLELDATRLRRAETLDRLATINQAILAYNGEHHEDAPLPTGIAGIRSSLVTRGFLPDHGRYGVDAWGDDLVEDPVGGTPVVRVTSVHLGVTSAGSSGSSGSTGSSGEGKGKKKGGKSPGGYAWGWGDDGKPGGGKRKKGKKGKK